MEENFNWVGWKDIMIPRSLIGDDITKGQGMWEREYTYILIPLGYGYDNYCFLLSSNLVHCSFVKEKYWFSICHDMKIELFYSPEEREEGKRYKRYHMTGYELFETVFSAYEVNFKKECEERLRKEQELKDRRKKAKIGSVICGLYKGNNYSDNDLKYREDRVFKAFFDSGTAYSNSKFEKVQNVKKKFVIAENISKYDFLRMETILNAYLEEYFLYFNLEETILRHINHKETVPDSKTLMKAHPEALVITDLVDISAKQIEYCDAAMEEIIRRMNKRIEIMLEE